MYVAGSDVVTHGSTSLGYVDCGVLWPIKYTCVQYCCAIWCIQICGQKFDKNTFGWVLKFLDLHPSLIFVSYYLIKIVTNLLTCVDRRKYLDTVKLTYITSIKKLPVLKCHLFLVLWIQPLVYREAAWSWSFGCWIYNYLCNLTVPITNKGVFEPCSWRSVLDTALCEFVSDLWFPPPIKLTAAI